MIWHNEKPSGEINKCATKVYFLKGLLEHPVCIILKVDDTITRVYTVHEDGLYTQEGKDYFLQCRFSFLFIKTHDVFNKRQVNDYYIILIKQHQNYEYNNQFQDFLDEK